MKITFLGSDFERISRDVVTNAPGLVPYTGGCWVKVYGRSAKARYERGLMLFGDEGVYLMGTHSLPPATLPVVAYCKEINPKTSHFCDSLKRKSFGRDDGCHFLPLDLINNWLIGNLGDDLLHMSLTPESLFLNGAGFLDTGQSTRKRRAAFL